jgi:hypothetical protein
MRPTNAWVRARDLRSRAGRTVRFTSVFALTLVALHLEPSRLCAQTAESKSTATAAPSPASTTPLGQFVARENLLFYIEFTGLDAHESSWHNTAASKMLNDTPLGEMLEIVSGQLLDKALIFFPGRRLSGPEFVKLVKAATRSGWVFALNLGPKAPDSGVTFVLRGGASKELKTLSGRLMGWMMGGQKPKIERKDGGRTIVVVPLKSAQAKAPEAAANWAWWPEKNDLVISVPFAFQADRIIAAIDGKAPSAVNHPIAQELRKAEGSFEPVCIAFVDVANRPNIPASMTVFLGQLHDVLGVQRIDLRWGFDADALMSVTRIVAPKPWKSVLSVFDQPTFDRGSLMPKPDSVESFVELSIDPSKLLETLEQAGAAGGEFKAQIEQLSETIKAAGATDLKKDILGHLGPRMMAYLAPGGSATTNDDSLETALKGGLSTTAAVTVMQSFFPKLTLVAEVANPEAFGKGLDTAMIAINNELKAQAIEKAESERASTDPPPSRGGGRTKAGAPGDGGDRTKRRRPKDPSYPHFQATIGQVKPDNSTSLVKSFVLTTPSDSPIRFGPSSFRPTILLDGKYVAFAVSSDAARAAIAAAKRKDWKPSADLVRACEKLPSQMVLLSVNDVRERLASLLASLPGTLQTMINTSITLAKSRGDGSPPAANAGQPAARSGMARGDRMGRRGGPRAAPPADGSPAGGPSDGDEGRRRGASTNPGGNAANSLSDSMIVLSVDPEKLPKAADLKEHIFPTTWTISPAEGEIRFITRGAFPDLSMLIGAIPAIGMSPGAQTLVQLPPPAAAPDPAAADAAAKAQTPAATQDISRPVPPGRRGRRGG